MSESPLVPKQARSREALERFIVAGEQLVAAGQFEATGISDIAALANSSVGSFYRLVGDKDALLRAVHDRFVEEARALIAVRLAPELHQGASLRDVLASFVSLLVEIYQEREGMLRALIVRATTHLDFRERIHALRDDVRTHLGRLVIPRASQIRHPRPLEAFAFAVKIVVGTLNHATVVSSMERESPESLVRELTAVMIRYLEVE